jgi:hypothetical protein
VPLATAASKNARTCEICSEGGSRAPVVKFIPLRFPERFWMIAAGGVNARSALNGLMTKVPPAGRLAKA